MKSFPGTETKAFPGPAEHAVLSTSLCPPAGLEALALLEHPPGMPPKVRGSAVEDMWDLGLQQATANKVTDSAFKN